MTSHHQDFPPPPAHQLEGKWLFVAWDYSSVAQDPYCTRNLEFTTQGITFSDTGEVARLGTLNDITSHPEDFQPPLWKVCIVKNHRGILFRIDVYIDLETLAAYVDRGVRFAGRPYLMSLVTRMQYNFNIHENQLFFERCKYHRLQTMATTPTVAVSSPVLAEEYSAQLLCPLHTFQSRAVRRMLDLEVYPETVHILPRNVVRLGTSLISVYAKLPENTLYTTATPVEVCLRGGFYHDRMGSGKTLSMVALCECNRPPVDGKIHNIPPATLIVCPAHVVSHWCAEIKKYTRSASVKVAVKADLDKLTHAELMSGKYQYVILSFNIFDNKSYSKPLHYYRRWHSPVRPSSRKDAVKERSRMHNHYVDHMRMSETDKSDHIFFPTAYDWWRVVVDEYHELHDKKYAVARIHVTSLRAQNVWLVSGTPAATLDEPRPHAAVDNTIVSLMFRKPSCISAYDFAVAMYEKRLVLSESYDFELPGVREEVVWLDLSTEERQLYEAVRTDGIEQQLRVCSYPRIAAVVQRSAKHVNTIQDMVDLAVSHIKTCISNIKATIQATEGALANYPPGAHEQRTREGQLARERMSTLAVQKAKLTELEMSARYIQSTGYGQDDCVICMEHMTQIAMLRSCGHRFCFDCCHRLVANTAACAVCRKPVCMRDVITTRNPEAGGEGGDNEEQRLYGTKMAALIRYICDSRDVKTLVFSQWDELLRDVGHKLQVYANVLYCRGSILQKQSAIDKFCNTGEHNLLLLSTLHSGSGCDLSKATRVILLDTIMKPLPQVSTIERQAIARCHRMGQTQEVKVVRFLMRNTVEQEQYERLMRERAALTGESTVASDGAGSSQHAPINLEEGVEDGVAGEISLMTPTPSSASSRVNDQAEPRARRPSSSRQSGRLVRQRRSSTPPHTP